jgi:hypothetical protein
MKGIPKQKRPIAFISGNLALFIFTNHEKPFPLKTPSSSRRSSFLGLIFFIFFNPNQDKSQQKRKKPLKRKLFSSSCFFPEVRAKVLRGVLLQFHSFRMGIYGKLVAPNIADQRNPETLT